MKLLSTLNVLLRANPQDFKAGQRVWGKTVSPAIVERDGKQYLSTIIESVLSMTTYVTETGAVVDRDSIKKFHEGQA